MPMIMNTITRVCYISFACAMFDPAPFKFVMRTHQQGRSHGNMESYLSQEPYTGDKSEITKR